VRPTASGTGTGVASLERLLVAALAKVVSASVNDDGALPVVLAICNLAVFSLPFLSILTPTTLSGPISLTKESETVPLELP